MRRDFISHPDGTLSFWGVQRSEQHHLICYGVAGDAGQPLRESTKGSWDFKKCGQVAVTPAAAAGSARFLRRDAPDYGGEVATGASGRFDPGNETRRA